MFKNYSKDQLLVLIGTCLYYLGLGGFLFNSQTAVLASVRSIYQFPMTRISMYTSFGYVASILGAALLGPLIFRLSQNLKKAYFIGMYICGVLGFLFLGFFATTPLFYIARFLISLSVSTISIIVSYVLNQWIHTNVGTAIGLASAFSGVGGMISNPLSAFLFGIFPFQQGILVLILFSAIFTVPSFFLIFRKPIPEAVPPMGNKKASAADDHSHDHSLLILIMLFAIVGAPRIASLFTNYLSIFAESIGYSSSFSSFLASILMFANITAKFAYGFLSDKVGTWKASILCQISVIVGVSLFLFLPQYPALIAIGTLGYGMFYGLTTVAINRMCMAAFGFSGTRKYQGMVTSVASLAAVIGSPAIGVVYDNTGSFNLLFAILLVLMAATIILSVITAKMRPEAPKTAK